MYTCYAILYLRINSEIVFIPWPSYTTQVQTSIGITGREAL